MTNPAWGAIGSLVSGTTGSVTPVAPAHVAGDWLYIVAEHSNASNGITPTLGGGSAFTLRGAQTNTTTLSGLALWRAKATSSSMTIPAIGGNAGQDHIGALVFTVSGLQNEVGDDPAAALVVLNLAAVASTSQTAATLGAINATNVLVIDIVSRVTDSAAANFSGWTNSALANLTERFDAGTTDGNGGGFGINTGELAAPATLSATTVTSVSNTRWAAISIALRSTIAASATVTGVSKAGSAGTITAKGAASATITGVSKAGSAGTLSATGGANASLTGVSATGSAGAISAEASATGSADATLTGVQATGSAGTITAIGDPVTEQPWELQITGFAPERGRGAIAKVRGVLARSRVGEIRCTGRASVRLRGVAASAAVGGMILTAESRVFPAERVSPMGVKVLRGWATATAYKRRKSPPMRTGNGCE